ncbi:hypothetical protein DAPPUDRAFT_103001 [Daphnia pulex]|uniref:Uncharacterized protein n=1 Tax=Daphnia pulex TaxID=6669 RepID=E9GI44_DAPPU|nr:hypothetical protein DAPPUDRAFT_103001 [Daphnia pulex]|eukprot:EFX80612.1 hypothetical protein DAPPUDRAFT_103001 [Daphnia pulex]
MSLSFLRVSQELFEKWVYTCWPPCAAYRRRLIRQLKSLWEKTVDQSFPVNSWRCQMRKFLIAKLKMAMSRLTRYFFKMAAVNLDFYLAKLSDHMAGLTAVLPKCRPLLRLILEEAHFKIWNFTSSNFAGCIELSFTFAVNVN